MSKMVLNKTDGVCYFCQKRKKPTVLLYYPVGGKTYSSTFCEGCVTKMGAMFNGKEKEKVDTIRDQEPRSPDTYSQGSWKDSE